MIEKGSTRAGSTRPRSSSALLLGANSNSPSWSRRSTPSRSSHRWPMPAPARRKTVCPDGTGPWKLKQLRPGHRGQKFSRNEGLVGRRHAARRRRFRLLRSDRADGHEAYQATGSTPSTSSTSTRAPSSSTTPTSTPSVRERRPRQIWMS